MQTPFIIMHGNADKITDPATSKKLHSESRASDKTLKLFGSDLQFLFEASWSRFEGALQIRYFLFSG